MNNNMENIKTAGDVLKSKLDPKIIILNNSDYTFNKVIEAMQEYASLQSSKDKERLRDVWDNARLKDKSGEIFEYVYESFEDYMKDAGEPVVSKDKEEIKRLKQTIEALAPKSKFSESIDPNGYATAAVKILHALHLVIGEHVNEFAMPVICTIIENNVYTAQQQRIAELEKAQKESVDLLSLSEQTFTKVAGVIAKLRSVARHFHSSEASEVLNVIDIDETLELASAKIKDHLATLPSNPL